MIDFQESAGRAFGESALRQRKTIRAGQYRIVLRCNTLNVPLTIPKIVSITNTMRLKLKTLSFPSKPDFNFYHYNHLTDAATFDASAIARSFAPSGGTMCGGLVNGQASQFSAITVVRTRVVWGFQPGTLYPLVRTLRPVCVFDQGSSFPIGVIGIRFDLPPTCYAPGEGGVVNQPATAVVGRMMMFAGIDMLPIEFREEMLVPLGSQDVTFRFDRGFRTKLIPGDGIDLSGGAPACCDLS